MYIFPALVSLREEKGDGKPEKGMKLLHLDTNSFLRGIQDNAGPSREVEWCRSVAEARVNLADSNTSWHSSVQVMACPLAFVASCRGCS